ncbi:MAG: helix-turn-helix transcriptional regulator [Bacteroidales bacterium]|nr:helix-turn-helix transcriptional regulator [Bacteroidales bacterium]
MADIKRKPRGFCYDKDGYSKLRLIEFIEGRRKSLNIKRSELAELLGMTEANIGYHLNPQKGNAKFTFIQIVKILEKLQATDEEILSLMKQK